jgi:hypothetical protein
MQLPQREPITLRVKVQALENEIQLSLGWGDPTYRSGIVFQIYHWDLLKVNTGISPEAATVYYCDVFREPVQSEDLLFRFKAHKSLSSPWRRRFI